MDVATAAGPEDLTDYGWDENDVERAAALQGAMLRLRHSEIDDKNYLRTQVRRKWKRRQKAYTKKRNSIIIRLEALDGSDPERVGALLKEMRQLRAEEKDDKATMALQAQTKWAERKRRYAEDRRRINTQLEVLRAQWQTAQGMKDTEV